MVRYWDYSTNFSKDIEKQLKDIEFLAEGHEGIVFKLPNKKILKIFRKESRWRDELNILKRTKKSKYFPKVYQYGELYIIREFVDGIRLDKFIKNFGLDKDISKKLLNLIQEFKRLKFTRLDIRCKDIYIDKKHRLFIIDPKNNFKKTIDYPRHFMKGLNKLNVLNEFLSNVKEINKELYLHWKESFELYIKKL